MTFASETKSEPDLFSHIFADNLKRYMEAYNISTNGVAVKTGVSQKTLWVTVNRKMCPPSIVRRKSVMRWALISDSALRG